MISDYFQKSAAAIGAVADHIPTIERMARGIFESQTAGGKLLVGGNGGSCADAEHFVGEMLCTFKDRSRRGFSAVSLTTNASAITAWSNDFGFQTYFKRQVESLGQEGDVLFLISTGGGDRSNGASMNLVEAADLALKNDMKVYSLSGKTGGELSRISHECVVVASFKTSHIQEAHIAIIHYICLVIDDLAKNATNE